MTNKPVTRKQARAKISGGSGVATKVAARAGALGLAATAGYAVGKAIDKKTGISTKIADAAIAIRNKIKGTPAKKAKPKTGMSMRDMQIKKALKDSGV
jgi:hypothetical protein